MSLLSFLLFIIIIIMCTHICSLANACSQSLVSAFSHSMSAHMCAVWSAHSCSAWPAHIHTAWSVHSLFCAYSRSLASAQLARQCIFAVWSAHSLVNAFSGSLISVVIVISVYNIRWPFWKRCLHRFQWYHIYKIHTKSPYHRTPLQHCYPVRISRPLQPA